MASSSSAYQPQFPSEMLAAALVWERQARGKDTSVYGHDANDGGEGSANRLHIS